MANAPVLSTQTINGKSSFAVRPKGKVWANADNKIVPDGDESATVMVSNGADTLPLHEVQKFPNYREHFEPVNSGDSFPPTDDAEEVALQEAAAPVKRGPGRPKSTAQINADENAKAKGLS